MKIISETSLDRFEAWSGGRDTLDVLIEKDIFVYCLQKKPDIDGALWSK